MSIDVFRRSLSLSTLRFALLLAAAAFFLFPFSLPPWADLTLARAQPPDHSEPTAELAVGIPVESDLGGSASQLFKLAVSPGQHVRLTVDKKDFYLSVTILTPDGQTVLEYPSRSFGQLKLSLAVSAPGVGYLLLNSLEKDPARRHYQLRIEEIRGSTVADQETTAAFQADAAAEALRAKWDQQSLRAAIVKYSEALRLWKVSGDRIEQLRTMRNIGACYFILSEYNASLKTYTGALSLSQSSEDKPAELDLLSDVGYVYSYLGDNSKALPLFEQVVSLLAEHADDQSIETLRRKAQALNNAGEVYYSFSQRRKALDYFNDALAIWVSVGDRSGEALARLNLGYTYTDLGDAQKAFDHYNQSLALWQAIGDRRGEALSRTALGGFENFLGENQLALDYHRQALQALQTLGNSQGEATTWNGIGQVYEDLNQPSAALDSYQRALQLNTSIGHRDFAALSQYYVGRVHQWMGDSARALADYSQSVQLSRQVRNRKVEAHALRGIATIHEGNGDGKKALEQYDEVLRLYEQIGDRRWQARTLNAIGHVYDTSRNKKEALNYYDRALLLSRAVEDHREEMASLYNLARVERNDVSLTPAISHISAAISLIESLRMKVVGEQLRTSYFASVHQYYELYIDLLMRAQPDKPDGGLVGEALQASERARARSLLEALTEQRGKSQSDQDLLGNERLVWQQLNFKLEAQAKLRNGQPTESEIAAGAAEIERLTTAYQEALDRIKQENPLYASLTQPQLLQVTGIQAELQPDTVLLEFSLGEERSYIWTVTRSSLQGYELPPRAIIETLADDVYDLLTARQAIRDETPGEYRRRVEVADANYWLRAAELSRLLLGKVSSQIAGKRLVIVCDGALHRVPIDALPEPDAAPAQGSAASLSGAVPLVFGHEVVTVPSVSVLSALQSKSPALPLAPRLIAVFADPVFDGRDARIDASVADSTAAAAPPDEADFRQALRDAGEGNEASLPRLSSSLREADAIAQLTSPRERLISTGFDANLESVMGGDLGNFRIIHFATHGVFDDEHPELSGLVLSRVDQSGRRRNGFLRVNDIYNLHLNADIVVLSACRTGLGRHVYGEGILGITRGFMYAGSRSVIASLWKVNDEATAELMKRFYSGMFREGLPPSAALRAAKEGMWKQERWRAPYFWAAFVMQGKYDQSAAVVGAHYGKPLVLAVVAAALCLAALLLFLLGGRYKSRYAERNTR